MISASHTPNGVHLYHDWDVTLQKYLLLQEQHEALRQHLDVIRLPYSSTRTIRSTAPNSPAVSPPLGPLSPFAPNHSSFRARRSSSPKEAPRRPSLPNQLQPTYGFHASAIAADMDESTAASLASEEAKLFDINEGIKRTLTELLNCETVRSDRVFRTWVQHRLMNAEKELRSGRRRRSGQRTRESSGVF